MNLVMAVEQLPNFAQWIGKRAVLSASQRILLTLVLLSMFEKELTMSMFDTDGRTENGYPAAQMSA